MTRILTLLLLGGMIFFFLTYPTLLAQNVVKNPLFSTTDLSFWSTEDPTPIVVLGNSSIGMYDYCCKKHPGYPDNNGAIEQEVHLIGGTTYLFSADISAKNCSN